VDRVLGIRHRCLGLPRLDGRECLAALKQDEALRDISFVILTTSEVERDVLAYPTTQEVETPIRPGKMQLWLITYFPMRVLPERSNGIAARSLGVGEKAGVKPLVRVIASASAGVLPRIMGIGQVPASQKATAKDPGDCAASGRERIIGQARPVAAGALSIQEQATSDLSCPGRCSARRASRGGRGWE
jgi:CheY-like chemotaxis protein